MKLNKTLLAVAIGVTSSASMADVLTDSDKFADVKIRYESNNVDNDKDTASALIVDAALGFETKEYNGFKFLGEVEVVDALIDNYAPVNSDYNVVADFLGGEINRAQVSYAKDGFGAIVGRQRIILDDARYVGNVGWRANEVTYDAATLKYATGDFAAQYSFINKRHFLNTTDQEAAHNLINVSYKTPYGKAVGYGYMLDDTNGNTNDTLGVSFAGKAAVADGVSAIYRVEFANQETSSDLETSRTFIELGAAVSGVSVVLGQETLGSDDGNGAFSIPLGTNHKFNGWTDVYLGGAGSNGLVDTYLKVATKKFGGAKLVGFYHTFEADEGGADLGSELDLLAVKKVGKYTLGAKYANFSATDESGKADVTKFWLWAATKF